MAQWKCQIEMYVPVGFYPYSDLYSKRTKLHIQLDRFIGLSTFIYCDFEKSFPCT